MRACKGRRQERERACAQNVRPLIPMCINGREKDVSDKVSQLCTKRLVQAEREGERERGGVQGEPRSEYQARHHTQSTAGITALCTCPVSPTHCDVHTHTANVDKIKQ